MGLRIYGRWRQSGHDGSGCRCRLGEELAAIKAVGGARIKIIMDADIY